MGADTPHGNTELRAPVSRNERDLVALRRDCEYLRSQCAELREEARRMRNAAIAARHVTQQQRATARALRSRPTPCPQADRHRPTEALTAIPRQRAPRANERRSSGRGALLREEPYDDDPL